MVVRWNASRHSLTFNVVLSIGIKRLHPNLINTRRPAEVTCRVRIGCWRKNLVYSTSEYCAPIWCRSTYIHLIDSVLNDSMRIVIGCLCPTPTGYLTILARIQPAELRRQGSTLSQAYQSLMDLKLLLHQLMVEPITANKERLRCRRPFEPAARKLLNKLSKLSIRAAQLIDYKWNMKYYKDLSELRLFVPKPNARPLEMVVLIPAWVQLNCFRTGVERF